MAAPPPVNRANRPALDTGALVSPAATIIDHSVFKQACYHAHLIPKDTEGGMEAASSVSPPSYLYTNRTSVALAPPVFSTPSTSIPNPQTKTMLLSSGMT